MAQVSALPATGGVLFDARDEGRTMRVGWHQDEDVLVLSIWRTDQCVATCRLTRGDAAELIGEIAAGLATPASPWTPPTLRSVSRTGWRPGRRRSS